MIIIELENADFGISDFYRVRDRWALLMFIAREGFVVTIGSYLSDLPGDIRANIIAR